MSSKTKKEIDQNQKIFLTKTKKKTRPRPKTNRPKPIQIFAQAIFWFWSNKVFGFGRTKKRWLWSKKSFGFGWGARLGQFNFDIGLGLKGSLNLNKSNGIDFGFNMYWIKI